MLGDFPKAMEQAMIESMRPTRSMLCSSSQTQRFAKGFNELALTMLLRGIQQGFGGSLQQGL